MSSEYHGRLRLFWERNNGHLNARLDFSFMAFTTRHCWQTRKFGWLLTLSGPLPHLAPLPPPYIYTKAESLGRGGDVGWPQSFQKSMWISEINQGIPQVGIAGGILASRIYLRNQLSFLKRLVVRELANRLALSKDFMWIFQTIDSENSQSQP